MPGKQINGNYPATRTRQSKAFCEGRAAQVAGDLIGTNPHLLGSEARMCWDKGFNSVAGTPATETCCAV